MTTTAQTFRGPYGGSRRMIRALVLLMLCVITIFGGIVLSRYAPKKEREWLPTNALTAIAPLMVSDDGDAASFLAALRESSAYYAALSETARVQLGPEQRTVLQVRQFLEEIDRIVSTSGLGSALNDYLMQYGSFFEPANRTAFFTGYYEASLRGSRTPSDRYAFPLYRRPPDLISVELDQFIAALPHSMPSQLRGRINGTALLPYHDRRAIDSDGALRNRNLEIVWVDDPIEAFFLHIQGSGRVELEDGSMIRVGYADKNGHAYRAIGGWLKSRKFLSDPVTMGSIKQFLRERPELQREVFDSNPSYVFFEERTSGPLGSLGRTLTPLRSIAADARLLPKGAIAFIRVTLPSIRGAPPRQLARLVFIQDTGGAIRGPGRVDLFTGAGVEAEEIAGPLQANGELYVLAPKQASAQ